MRYIIALVVAMFVWFGTAYGWEEQRFFEIGDSSEKLRILSSTDTVYLSPLIEAFIAHHGDIEVEYLVTGTADIFRLVREQPDAFDLVISSAMDLQIKLVNDGFGVRFEDIDYPDWAHWRKILFGFTAEPAAIVINKAAFADLSVPKTRQDLIELLRHAPEGFRGRLATYDIRESGVGYLFASQDARTSETYWRLTEVMGGLGTQLYCCSGEMIDAVARGDMLVAYNVLGSYAVARAETEDKIEVIVPSDFATTMMRTLFVAKDAPHLEPAQKFLEFTLDFFSNEAYEQSAALPRLISNNEQTKRQLIPLEPSLMIYLDWLKRDAFTSEWESAVIQ